MEFSDASLLIIAGGKSSRMGRDKRFLPYDGEGLLERLARRAAALPLCGALPLRGGKDACPAGYR